MSITCIHKTIKRSDNSKVTYLRPAKTTRQGEVTKGTSDESDNLDVTLS